jgi:hypothetical protein
VTRLFFTSAGPEAKIGARERFGCASSAGHLNQSSGSVALQRQIPVLADDVLAEAVPRLT